MVERHQQERILTDIPEDNQQSVGSDIQLCGEVLQFAEESLQSGWFNGKEQCGGNGSVDD